MTHATDKDKDNELYNIHDFGIDLKNREIYLHSPIDSEEESGIEFRTAIRLQKNIRYFNLISNDPILIHMHLPGGIWEDCLGMYDTIKASKSKVIILAYAKVESASSVLLQASDYRILMPNTHVLIHYGSLSIDNEHKADMRNTKTHKKQYFAPLEDEPACSDSIGAIFFKVWNKTDHH